MKNPANEMMMGDHLKYFAYTIVEMLVIIIIVSI
jgi:competence protein ComGC